MRYIYQYTPCLDISLPIYQYTPCLAFCLYDFFLDWFFNCILCFCSPPLTAPYCSMHIRWRGVALFLHCPCTKYTHLSGRQYHSFLKSNKVIGLYKSIKPNAQPITKLNQSYFIFIKFRGHIYIYSHYIAFWSVVFE